MNSRKAALVLNRSTKVEKWEAEPIARMYLVCKLCGAGVHYGDLNWHLGSRHCASDLLTMGRILDFYSTEAPNGKP